MQIWPLNVFLVIFRLFRQLLGLVMTSNQPIVTVDHRLDDLPLYNVPPNYLRSYHYETREINYGLVQDAASVVRQQVVKVCKALKPVTDFTSRSYNSVAYYVPQMEAKHAYDGLKQGQFDVRRGVAGAMGFLLPYALPRTKWFRGARRFFVAVVGGTAGYLFADNMYSFLDQRVKQLTGTPPLQAPPPSDAPSH